MRVHDLSSKNDAPAVDINESITNVIIEISSKRLGTTAVIDDGKMIGVITDGDLRRMIENHDDYKHLTAKDIMTKEPLSIEKDSLIVNALSLMRENNITQLPVMDGDNYSGVIHLHDILKEGIF